MNALTCSTRIAVTVVIQDDTGRVAALLVALAALAGLLVRFGLFVSGVAGVISDAVYAVTFTAQVFIIGFKAFAYGLGVTL